MSSGSFRRARNPISTVPLRRCGIPSDPGARPSNSASPWRSRREPSCRSRHSTRRSPVPGSGRPSRCTPRSAQVHRCTTSRYAPRQAGCHGCVPRSGTMPGSANGRSSSSSLINQDRSRFTLRRMGYSGGTLFRRSSFIYAAACYNFNMNTPLSIKS